MIKIRHITVLCQHCGRDIHVRTAICDDCADTKLNDAVEKGHGGIVNLMRQAREYLISPTDENLKDLRETCSWFLHNESRGS